MNLFQKGLLAFVVVILVAVVTVAVLAGVQTESEFRRYAVLSSARTQRMAEALINYYRPRDSWQGLDTVFPDLLAASGGRGQQSRSGGQSSQDIVYIVADADFRIVATSTGEQNGELSERTTALPLMLGEQIVGYVVPEYTGEGHMVLDGPASESLARLRWALVIGGAVALLLALPIAGLLTRSIVAPVRALTQTAETISSGRFDVRAAVGGRDEVARLAATFNQMAANLQRGEELRQAQTADIAHELRNPLAILQSTLEALADGVYSPTSENLDPALDQVRTLNRLIEDLRTLALVDAGQLRLDLQAVDLNALITRIAESYRDTLRGQGIKLSLNLADSLPGVTADYARITQVLNNILTNTTRYVPAGCEVRIATLLEHDGVLVRVSDNGPGVSDDQIVHLFDRFWRGEPSRSRNTGGAGLGLSIAYQIIDAHGGKMWAESTPGGGLTLNFVLPKA